MTCAHPRRCINLMRKFLYDSHNLTYQNVKRSIILRKDPDGGFSTDLTAENTPFIQIFYDFEEYKEDEIFRKFIISLDSSMQEFANITLSLLHEMGHNVHRTKTFSYDRTEMMKKLKEEAQSEEDLHFSYFRLPDELAATKWAINWLKKKENRLLAKQFEKDYFEAFRG